MRDTIPKFLMALNDAAEAIKRFSAKLDKISERWKNVPLVEFPTTRRTIMCCAELTDARLRLLTDFRDQRS